VKTKLAKRCPALCLLIFWSQIGQTLEAKDAYIQPNGRIEEMERKADLVFKGEALSTEPVTNSGFFLSSMAPQATKFKVISVLEGNTPTNQIVFEHYTKQPGVWSGPHWPANYQFEDGKYYLVFAARLDRPVEYYYSPPPDAAAQPATFRQIMDAPRYDDDGVIRTLDASPLTVSSIKEAYWTELNRLLTNDISLDALYAVQKLNTLSERCGQDRGHPKEFEREAILDQIISLTTNRDEQVAVTAINCFQISGLITERRGDLNLSFSLANSAPQPCVDKVRGYSGALIDIANNASSAPCRAAAIEALTGTRFANVSNALPRWLKDTDTNARSQAIFLLADFPGDFANQKLREFAEDPSPRIRARAADTIGNGLLEPLLPVLTKLFSNSVGPTNPISRWPQAVLDSDVHTSAGNALLKFNLDQVGDILKTNLNDTGFKLQFLCKLAQSNAQPWIDQMVEVMDARRVSNVKQAEADKFPPETYMTLSGTHYQCWKIIYNYLQGLPKADFAGSKWNHCLDTLENAGNTGSQEPIQLYELYRMKGLDERAKSFREYCEKTFGYDMRLFFKQADERLAQSPPAN
jgi:hypothetical protein